MFDLIALPPEVGRRPAAQMVKVVSTDDTDTSVSEPLEQSLSLQEHVAALANHARKGKEPKKYVRKLLFRAGVVEPTPKRK
jgi:hypothetical protein